MPLKRISRAALQEKRNIIEKDIEPLENKVQNIDIEIANLQKRRNDVQGAIQSKKNDMRDLKEDRSNG